MKIEWKKVTTISQITAIILFAVVFFVGFLIGMKYENKKVLGEPIITTKFICAENKFIDASFYKNFVSIKTNSIKKIYLPQTISASGIRYANSDESIVFWNKGDTAFITEGNPNEETYKDCMLDSKETR